MKDKKSSEMPVIKRSASPQLQASRISICSMCEFFKNEECTALPCDIMKLVSKVDSECPEGRW